MNKKTRERFEKLETRIKDLEANIEALKIEVDPLNIASSIARHNATCDNISELIAFPFVR